MSNVERDSDYDYIPPLAKRDDSSPFIKKGSQCGECGMKFDYGIAYGYCCSRPNCPSGWSGR